MRRFFGPVAIVATVICALAAFAVVASAHTVLHASTVSIQFKRGHGTAGDVFSGQVNSSKVACQHRTVKLFRRVNTTSKVLVDKTHTDKSGAWQITLASTPSGTYFAHATKRVLLSTPKHQHVCSAANSRDVNVKAKP